MSERICHCWKDKIEWAAEAYGVDSEEWAAAFLDNATCMLLSGHEGPHEFVPDSEITVAFVPSGA